MLEGQNSTKKVQFCPAFLLCGAICLICPFPASLTVMADGLLTMTLKDEDTGEPVISRMELYRHLPQVSARAQKRLSKSATKPIPIRQTVPAGIGTVIDEQVELELPEGDYRFKLIRGPEYRLLTGGFTMEKTSLDENHTKLPRMVDMYKEGWVSGDCFVTPSPNSLPLRMASEDLHVAAVTEDVPAKPIPKRGKDRPLTHAPSWIRHDVTFAQGLAYYGLDQQTAESLQAEPDALDGLPFLIAAANADQETPVKIAIENPFSWQLPIWLASGKVDGYFVLGDWLRLDRQVLTIKEGPVPDYFAIREATQVGRYGEQIYRHLLDCGIRLVPLAGGGDQSTDLPVGYNRMYVTSAVDDGYEDSLQKPSVAATAEQWWANLWQGHSVATNGPMLRPLIGGKVPGYTFRGSAGQALRLQPELNLSVRDPVDYLEVIHNNQVHYSARLDEFAKAGGKIPPIEASESGWVIIRVLTLHDQHYRAAVTAPWWIEFDGERRVSKTSVEFFQTWQAGYEKHLQKTQAGQLAQYAPYIQAARKFWQMKLSEAVD